MRRHRVLAAVLPLCLVATLTACKSADSAEEPPAESASERIIEDVDAAAQATVEAGSEEARVLAERLITPADVEKVIGQSGLKLVPKDPSAGAGGDANIATADGQLVVMVSVGDGDFYELTKSGANFGREYDGVGDEAYAGPAKDISPDGTEYLLGARSGGWGVVIASFFDPASAGAPYLTVEQLEQLTALAISRL